LIRIGETVFDFFIKEFKQKIMSSSKSIDVGLTIYSSNGIKEVSMIDRKFAAK